jgi:transposase
VSGWNLYSEIGRPPIDPELMIRMLIVGYCYGIRFERGGIDYTWPIATAA